MNKEQLTREPNDRRNDDLGPPGGWKERRHNTERRIPTVEEQTMTETEWLSYFGTPAKESPDTTMADEAAADILGKART